MIVAAEDRLLRNFVQLQKTEAEDFRRRKTTYDMLWQTFIELASIESSLVRLMGQGELRFRVAVGDHGASEAPTEIGAWEVKIGIDGPEVIVFGAFPEKDGGCLAQQETQYFSDSALAREFLLDQIIEKVALLRLRRRGALPAN